MGIGSSSSAAVPAVLPSIWGVFATLGYLTIILKIYIGVILASLGTFLYNIGEGPILAEYDFIVIGSGSAGSAVASRLAENPNYRVLVLEAGQLPVYEAKIPLLAPLLEETSMDWQFVSEPLENAGRCLNDQRVKIPQGKALGGTSEINGMIYTRGNKADYDDLAMAGNPGWSYEEVLPYFLKLENNQNAEYTQTRYHRTGGPVNVEDIRYHSPLADAYLAAFKELGLESIDVNGESQFGCMKPQGNCKEGRRFSAVDAYLSDARTRNNLQISMNSFVTRIVIDPETKQALGVEFMMGGVTRFVRATKEVILSAGALQSPKLLMLSGVGPADQLNKFNISVIKDLPVGKEMNDHLVTTGLTYLINQPVSFVTGRVFANSLSNIYNYYLANTGPLTSLCTFEAIGFIQTRLSTSSKPDIEILVSSGSYNSDAGTSLRKMLNMKDECYEAVYRKWDSYDVFNINVVLLHPKSKGSVTLRSANPLDPLVITPNYFKEPQDVAVMIEGIKFASRFANTTALKNFGATLIQPGFPRCGSFTFGTDEWCDCYARELTTTLQHTTSTCKMGPVGDPTSVVDNRLRVHGVSKLRVVDASVLLSISGHPNIPAMMVGEKAADMIKQDNP